MNTLESKLSEVIFASIGTASMCWTGIPASAFDSTEAEKVGKKCTESCTALAIDFAKGFAEFLGVKHVEELMGSYIKSLQ